MTPRDHGPLEQPRDAEHRTKIDTTVARAYQIEMYEESLKKNVIVVMDTGSGKTMVATLRIRKELESAGPGKTIWFLTPTVELCLQQCKSLQEKIRFTEIRSFSSRDNVDNWKSGDLWEAALRNVGVAVATYGVLHNGLSDGYLKMGSIPLIVFDEVHNCVKKHPGAKIMTQFYWEDKKRGKPIPHIMGLTASPTNKLNPAKLAKLEGDMNARCVTPRFHRESLQAHVNRPAATLEYYRACIAERPRCSGAGSITTVLESLDINDDRDIIRWRSEETEPSREKLNRALLTGKTFVREQLRLFARKTGQMNEQLGSYASNFYVATVQALALEQEKGQGQIDLGWDYQSRKYLADQVRGVSYDRKLLTKPPSSDSISAKVKCLIKVLGSHMARTDGNSRGIVFVTERATTVVLHQILSQHPDINKIFRVGAVVGSSKHERGRRDLGDMFGPADQSASIEKFRTGETNLLVATSVLEEGIDVPSCNLAVCFDPPPSAKSFIQRRGRARKSGAHYFILLDEALKDKATDWEDLEAKLQEQYDRDDKEAGELAQLAEGEPIRPPFRVEETGAVLDMENAKARLGQFCNKAGPRRYVDKNPYYLFWEEVDPQAAAKTSGQRPQTKGKVVLPTYVPQEVRVKESRTAWQTEKSASKDAAFEACLKLYNIGLLNKHLKPLTDEEYGFGEDDSGMVEIAEQLNPWVSVAKAWREGRELRTYLVETKDASGCSISCLEMVIPAKIENMHLGKQGVRRIVHFRQVKSSQPPTAGTDDVSRLAFLFLSKPKSVNQRELVIFNGAANRGESQPNELSPVHSDGSQAIPLILHKIEAHLVAQELRATLLSDGRGEPSTTSLIRAAITAPARGETEYSRYEFLGATCLKLFTTLSLMAKNPLWPEGYLTARRDRMVSNTSLCRAARCCHFDKFILIRRFNADGSDSVDADASEASLGGGATRQVGIRTVAHAVKSVVGAGMMAGGYSTALTWTKAVVGEVDLPSLEVGRRQLWDLLLDSPDGGAPLPAPLGPLQALSGHAFARPALLVEATTHASYPAARASYGRLAFLGNAVVEAAVAAAVHAHTPRLSAARMHSCRAALTARAFLGFVAMEWRGNVARSSDVQAAWKGGPAREVRRDDAELPLWRFLAHGSAEVAREMDAAEGRYADLRASINEAIHSSAAAPYPWLQLAQLGAVHFHADMVASLVGAVFVDSGDMATCKHVLERMGVLTYLQKVLEENVDVAHPKERLQALAGSSGVRYDTGEVEEAEGGKWKCAVFVGEDRVVESMGSASRDEAELRAATKAAALLRTAAAA